jgi:hypothetical protein
VFGSRLGDDECLPSVREISGDRLGRELAPWLGISWWMVDPAAIDAGRRPR